MTLNVSTQSITISNSDGTTKFSSEDRLLYRTNLYTGTLTLGGSNGYGAGVLLVDANIGDRRNWSLDDSNLITVKVRPTFSQGNIGISLLDNTFDLSSGLVVDYAQTNGVYRITRHTILSAHIRQFYSEQYPAGRVFYTPPGFTFDLFNSLGLPIVEFTYYDLVGDGYSTFDSPYPPAFNDRYVDCINDVKTPTKIITFDYEISVFRWK
jgi:hypothetical protein